MTDLAKIASVILVILGVPLTLLGLLFGGLGLSGVASRVGRAPGFESGVGEAYAWFFTWLGLLALVLGFVEVWAGSRAWEGKGRGRVLGIVYGVVGSLVGLLGLRFDEGGLLGGPRFGFGVGFWIATVLLYGFVALALVFRWKTPATT